VKKFLPLLGVALAGVLAVIVIAGCGGGGTSYGSSNNANGGAAADATLGTARTSLGKFLVDGKGRTVYLFQADKPDMSNCSGACASVWPPLSANAKPLAKGGVVASRISTIKGSGGKPQLAYNGHPLYYYAGDTSPGATKGQGLNQFGAEWYVIAPNGSKIDNA
jgi:predicted lipoprotein with Yx(FWY)xxD motif